ncbi:MAG: formylglycine-generating enzyme family protein [Nodosilinea sp.]
MNSDFTLKDEGQLQVEVFQEYYGEEALRLACHGAFPLTLTPELLYCLRENFVPDVPWYTIGDVLLSGLCRQVSYNLYEIKTETRRALLNVLKEDLGEQAENRVLSIEEFMVLYINQYLNIKSHHVTRMIGNEISFRWTALAPFRSEEDLIHAIEDYLKGLVISAADLEERFWMGQAIKRQSDWLIDRNFRVMVVEWADLLAKHGTINEPEPVAVAASLSASSFLTVDREDEELESFDFEVVTIDDYGNEIARETKQAFCFWERFGEKIFPIQMIAIPGGRFEMGSPLDEKGAFYIQRPQHSVTVQPFFMSRTTITQSQWQFIAELEPIECGLSSQPLRPERQEMGFPVENVTWHEAKEFCARLSVYTGRTYRLPSEAEWEYACRAGTTTPFHFGSTITTTLANFYGVETYKQEPRGLYRQQPTVVGSFLPNAFGLHDMHGNVWEWCLDHWHDRYNDNAPSDGSAWLSEDSTALRVLRGGSWTVPSKQCSSAYRLRSATNRHNHFGIRVVCEEKIE